MKPIINFLKDYRLAILAAVIILFFGWGINGVLNNQHFKEWTHTSIQSIEIGDLLILILVHAFFSKSYTNK